jgi:hypothetical protein
MRQKHDGYDKSQMGATLDRAFKIGGRFALT